MVLLVKRSKADKQFFELLKNARNGIINFKGKIGKYHDTFQLSLFPT